MNGPGTAQARQRHRLWLERLAAPTRPRQRRMHGALTVAGWLLIVQCGLLAHLLARVFVDGQAPAALVHALAALLAVMLVRALLSWMVQRDAAVVAEVAIATLRREVYRRSLDRGPLWLRQRSAAALAELGIAHADALHGYYSGYRPARVEVLTVPVAILLAVSATDWIAGLILLVAAPLIPLFMMLVGWGAEAAGRRQLQDLARLGGYFADRLRGLGLIRVHGRSAAELGNVASAAEGLRQRSLRVLRIAFLSSAVLEFFASISVALVAVYLGLRYLGMLGPRLAPPTLQAGLFCLLLAAEFFAPLRRLAAHYHDRADALAALSEIERHLGMPMPMPAAPTPRMRPAGVMVAVRDASLRPSGARRAVLGGLSFEVPTGTRLAIVGPSGCGKSSLLDALAGLLPPEHGEVAVAAGARIGFAGQLPYLFHGSIAANLRLAQADATPQQLRRAARAAQVLRFADRLPDGLDSHVGERGFGLSGGEARRIGLARALLRDPQLLLLDEPSAFLDAGTERALLAALSRFCRHRTIIIATHSPRVMRWAGRVLRLPDGTVEPYPPGGSRGA